MTNLSFYNNRKFRKLRKTAVILHAIVKATAVVIGAVIAELAIAVFLSPQPVRADVSHQQKVVKQLRAGNQNRYEVKVRESLESQKEFGNTASALQTLDHLFGKIEMKVRPRAKYNKEEAIEALKVIDGVLKEEGKFEYRKNNLLIEGLEIQKDGKRFIDCDDYSSIYLFAGERLGLSLEPVYVPRHVFLRCRIDDYSSFYWEPTIAAEKDAGFYKDLLNIPDENSYPKILNEKEFEAIHFCNLGVAWYEKGDYAKVIEYSERAIRLNPKYAVAFNNLGVAYAKQGNLDVAMECYKRATSINPKYAAAFSNIGVTFYRLGYFEKAVEYFEKAIELDPRFDRAYNNKVIVLMKNGEHNRALNFANKIHDLKQRNARHLRN
jgi:tetratricopeptide (TPR) repeat protein